MTKITPILLAILAFSTSPLAVGQVTKSEDDRAADVRAGDAIKQLEINLDKKRVELGMEGFLEKISSLGHFEKLTSSPSGTWRGLCYVF